MKKVKRISTIVLICIFFALVVSSAAFAKPDIIAGDRQDVTSTRGGGHRHVDINIYKAPENAGKKKKAANYPGVLDPRNEEWYKQSISVRNQADTSLCWAFSATSAAQISYAKEINEQSSPANAASSQKGTEQVKGTGGDIKTVGQLSPVHLAYFFYNRVVDPLGGTEGDFNPMSGSRWTDNGGSCYLTQVDMATWSGLAAEEDAPFILRDGRDAGEMVLDDSLAYKNKLVQQNSVVYDELNTDTDEERRNAINTVKEMITKYGAVVVSLQIDDKFLTNDRKAFFNNKYSNNNHEVTIVGWDDNYSKDNFKPQDSSEGGAQNKPDIDGAWIVMNSWGEEVNDNGYFYASYASKDILADGIVAFDMEPADKDKMNFQYDGSTDYSSLFWKEGDRCANVFKAPDNKDIELTDVFFEELVDGTAEYKIEVFTDLTDGQDPENGTKKCSFKTTTTTPGFKTIPLSDPVEVESGETFSIVISCESDGALGIEVNGENETYEESGIMVKEGQSFFSDYSEREWEDLYEYDACARIKGIARKTRTWADPEYKWSADNSSVTASRKCVEDSSLVQTEAVKTTAEVVKQATCSAKGKTKYTATFKNNSFRTQTKTVEDIDIDPSSHDWGSPAYAWSADNSKVTATRECSRCGGTEFETVDTTSAITKNATASVDGERIYTAVFSNRAFRMQQKAVKEYAPPAGTQLSAKVKGKKKQIKVTCAKADGASSYVIEYRKADTGSKAGWVSVSSAKNTITLKKLKKNGIYELRAAAVKNTPSGKLMGNYSAVSRCYVRDIKALKVKGKKRSVRVTWKKDKKAKGYLLSYSKRKNMKGAKTITLKGKKRVSRTVRKLKSGRKYYVMVRPYKIRNGKIYPGGSPVKRVRVK